VTAQQLSAILLDEAPEDEDPKDFCMRQNLGPELLITFLDPPGESIMIRCDHVPDAYYRGNMMHPGVEPAPATGQLRQIGGKGGEDGGRFAMEAVYTARYEGNESEGTAGDDHDYDDDEDELARFGVWHRPLRFKFINCEDEDGELNETTQLCDRPPARYS
jgi:hypothetical protein